MIHTIIEIMPLIYHNVVRYVIPRRKQLECLRTEKFQASYDRVLRDCNCPSLILRSTINATHRTTLMQRDAKILSPPRCVVSDPHYPINPPLVLRAPPSKAGSNPQPLLVPSKLVELQNCFLSLQNLEDQNSQRVIKRSCRPILVLPGS